MPKKLKILISSYACSPFSGSEPGMGWNFIKSLSSYHELHVIVEKKKFEKPINEYLDNNPTLKQNLKFYFICKKRSKILRKIWPPSYYWFYKSWQKKAYNLAIELEKNENFDIIHQLNMVGFREPGFLWKINKPFVWGPIGGLENSSFKLLTMLDFEGVVYFGLRNLINLVQRNFLTRPKKAAFRAKSKLIAATPSNSLLIKKIWKQDSIIISEVGNESQKDIVVNKRMIGEKLKIIWSAQHTQGKNLPLLLNVLKEVNFKFELHVLGSGKMTQKWQKRAKKYKINNYCQWHGWLNRNDALKIMKSGHVFCITSIKDLTSSVLLEAISLGLPVITLDQCGFSHVINESCGIKLKIDTLNKLKNSYKEALNIIENDEFYRQTLSSGAFLRSKDFSWHNKIKKINNIYNELINQ